jgi:SAM-dependent methyltransferase
VPTRLDDNGGMDLDSLAALRSESGQALLALVDAAYSGGNALSVSASLRSAHRPEVVAAALTQVDLRRRAAAKFGDRAALMYFTRDALEQATRAPVAAHRAGRVVATAGAGGSVVDLCCGIGGDLVALRAAGADAVGIELDPLRAALARANLAALGLGGSVTVADATTAPLDGFDLAFADPTRRRGDRRIFDPAGFTPPWSFVEALLRRRSVVKTAPGIPHRLVPKGVEAEWVSDGPGVKETVLWAPGLARVRRRATLLPSGDCVTDEDDPGHVDVVPPAAFLYEPAGAVIRSGLVGAVARIVGGGLLDPHIAYVTSDTAVPTPFARQYRVLELLPFQEKRLRAALENRGVGTLTIKKRGVDITPEVLRQRLALRGDAAATIVLTRAAGHAIVLLVEPDAG